MFTKSKILDWSMMLLLLYIIFHTVYGNRGIISYYMVRSEVNELSDQSEAVAFERLIIEKQVKDLNSRNVDKDFLDEIARRELLLSDPNEKIIIKKKNDR